MQLWGSMDQQRCAVLPHLLQGKPTQTTSRRCGLLVRRHRQRGKSLQRPNSMWRIRMAENAHPSSDEAIPPSAVPSLQVRGVSKAFGAVQALQDVDFEVYAGEVVGLVGDNGAGKSTLIKIISGAYIPDKGEIFIDGARVSITTPKDATHVGIETVYQDLALCDNLDVVANLFLGREERSTFIPYLVRPI